MIFDNETLKVSAAKIVSGLVAKGIPLSRGVAEFASEERLNEEQIKRVIEAVNIITHLHFMKNEADKTTEFPVAQFHAVQSYMVAPDYSRSAEEGGLAKQASLRKPRVESLFQVNTGTLYKQASYESVNLDAERDEIQGRLDAKLNLIKMARYLEDAEITALELSDRLVKQARAYINEPNSYDRLKIAMSDDKDSFIKVARVLYPVLEKAALFNTGIYLDKDMKSAMELKALIKQANDAESVVTLYKHRLYTLEKASSNTKTTPKPFTKMHVPGLGGVVGGTTGSVGRAMGFTAGAAIGVPVAAAKAVGKKLLGPSTPGASTASKIATGSGGVLKNASGLLGPAFDFMSAKSMTHRKPLFKTLHGL